MLNIINTGKFLLQHQFNKFYPVITDKYHDPASQIDFVVYKANAKDKKQKSQSKVILTFHGMTMLGSDDPKFVNACCSLAGCGYTVISAQMDSMQNLLINTSVTEETVKIIKAAADCTEICPEGKVSIFAASFAGGICMMAASDERIADKINSICLIGSFTDIESSINYLMSAQNSDNYGRLIILKNLLKYSFDVPESICKAFDIALADNFYKREYPELPDYLATLSVSDYDIATRLLNEPYFRLYHWNRIKKNKYIEEMLEKFSVRNYLKNVNAPVLIIHGIYDNVIPPLESIRLYNELQKTKIRSKLVLTPLMGHSELKLNLKILPLIFDLFKGLSFYFSCV
jgi:pimeloyl-ACP methyl ester carboxylesterase